MCISIYKYIYYIYHICYIYIIYRIYVTYDIYNIYITYIHICIHIYIEKGKPPATSCAEHCPLLSFSYFIWFSLKKFKILYMLLEKQFNEHRSLRASLVVQWLRIRLPMQGTWVRAPVREDPTCRGATKPVHHNYWACTLEPASHNHWAHVPQLLKPVRLEPMLHNKRSHCNEKPGHCSEE